LALIGYRCVPSAGPSPSGRNAVLFDGGGYLNIVAGTGDLGSNSAVPSSSSPSANAFIKCSGGVLNVTDCKNTFQAGTWANQIENVGGTTVTGSVGTW
jgi:hypothetical protein